MIVERAGEAAAAVACVRGVAAGSGRISSLQPVQTGRVRQRERKESEAGYKGLLRRDAWRSRSAAL